MNKFIKMNGGIGDMLLLTIIFKKIFDLTGKRATLISEFGEIFLFNNSVHKVYKKENLWTHLLELVGKNYHEITYRCWSQLLPDKKAIFNTHVIEQFCHQLNLSGWIPLKPEIFFSAQELSSFKKNSPEYIVIQSQASHSNHPQTTKDWSIESMQEVVYRLGKNFEILQLGSEKDVRLKGVSNFCGKTSIREAGLFLKNARLFVGLEGALMHMARAVDCPSVIIWGGRLKPKQIGYPCFENITSELDCSPCWIPNACPHNLKCMQDIKSNHVLESCERILSVKDISLNVDKINVETKISSKKMKNEIADFPPHLDHLITWN